MGRNLTWSLLVFWSATCAGQNTFSIAHIDPSASSASGRSVFETEDGYLIFSAQNDLITGLTWLYTAKIDALGQVIGTHAFGSSRYLDSGVTDCITKNPDGSYTAAVSHFISGQPDSLYLYHFDPEGDTISRHLIGIEAALGVRDCVRTEDGNYLIAGWCTRIVEPLEECACIRKVSPMGIELWRRLNVEHLAFYTINALPDGSFLIGGHRYNQGVNETVILKVDSAGGTIWTRYIGGYSSYTGGSGHSALMADGNYLIPGTWLPADSAGVDEHGFAALYCFSPGGDPLWRKDLFYGRMAGATLIRSRPDGGFVFPTGYYQVPRDPDWATTVWHADAQGDTLFHRKYWYYGGYGAENAASYGMDITSDGGTIFTGVARQGQDGEFPYRRYVWVLKLDEYGCLTPGCHTVGVQELELALQSALEIAPNPASERVQMRLALPEGYRLEGPVEARLLDAKGKEVLREQVATTTTELRGQLDVRGLPSGLYYLHLRDGVKWLAGGKIIVE